MNTEHRKLAIQAWESLKPLLIQSKENTEDAWIQRYLPNIDETENYFWGSLDRFSLLLTVMDRYLAKGSKILDAGAGYGIQPAIYQQAGYQAYASDIYDNLPIYAPLNINYQRWHIEADKAPFDDASLDAVVLSQTIEHFTFSPKQPIAEMIRILKPGGLLLIDAPNISSFHNISRLIRGKTLHWELKKHYLQQQPYMTNGVPYYDRHNHEYCMQDFQDIADFFNLDIKEKAFYSPVNRKTKSTLAIAISRIRDVIPHWRKGLYCLYQKT